MQIDKQTAAAAALWVHMKTAATRQGPRTVVRRNYSRLVERLDLCERLSLRVVRAACALHGLSQGHVAPVHAMPEIIAQVRDNHWLSQHHVGSSADDHCGVVGAYTVSACCEGREDPHAVPVE